MDRLLAPVLTAVSGFALAKLTQRSSSMRARHCTPANPGSREEQGRRAMAAAAGPELNLAALEEASPREFYLADASLEELADCFAVVAGHHLPLHSKVLGVQVEVLRDLFRSQKEGGVAAQVR
jgi:hypothetical protein